MALKTVLLDTFCYRAVHFTGYSRALLKFKDNNGGPFVRGLLYACSAAEDVGCILQLSLNTFVQW